MSDDRTKPGLVVWTTAGLALLILYELSFEPAAWICSRTESKRIPPIYLPFEHALMHPTRIRDALVWLATIGMPSGGRVELLQRNMRRVICIDHDPPLVRTRGVNLGID